MNILTPDMVATIKGAMLSFVATVNADGTPNLSPKASLTVREDALFFADICSPKTIENLARNPAIAINVVNIFERRGYRFAGTASILRKGDPNYESVADWVHEVNGPGYPVHHVIRIAVAEARPVLSPAYSFGQGVSAEKLSNDYMKKYGVQKLA